MVLRFSFPSLVVVCDSGGNGWGELGRLARDMLRVKYFIG